MISPELNEPGFWLMRRLVGMVRWLLTARIRSELFFATGRDGDWAGRVVEVGPWRDVLVIRCERGVYVITADNHSLDDWQIQKLSSNRSIPETY